MHYYEVRTRCSKNDGEYGRTRYIETETDNPSYQEVASILTKKCMSECNYYGPLVYVKPKECMGHIISILEISQEQYESEVIVDDVWNEYHQVWDNRIPLWKTICYGFLLLVLYGSVTVAIVLLLKLCMDLTTYNPSLPTQIYSVSENNETALLLKEIISELTTM